MTMSMNMFWLLHNELLTMAETSSLVYHMFCFPCVCVIIESCCWYEEAFHVRADGAGGWLTCNPVWRKCWVSGGGWRDRFYLCSGHPVKMNHTVNTGFLKLRPRWSWKILELGVGADGGRDGCPCSDTGACSWKLTHLLVGVPFILHAHTRRCTRTHAERRRSGCISSLPHCYCHFAHLLCVCCESGRLQSKCFFTVFLVFIQTN